MNVPRAASILATGTLLAACVADPVYTAPYSLFTTEQVVSSTDNRRSFALKVDGTEIQRGESLPVKPGLRTVQVSMSGQSGHAPKQLTIDAQPCTRYILIASRSASTDDDWEPSLNRSEPIGDCATKFAPK
jgi:hypothetical protein